MSSITPKGKCTYSLSETECRLLDRLAQRRQDAKQRYKVRSKKMDVNRNDLAIHRMGMAAQYVVGKFLGHDPDFSIKVRGNKTGIDIRTPVGTIDVQFRSKVGYTFSLDGIDESEFKADIGVLVYPEVMAAGEAYWPVSWIRREEFVKVAELENWGYGDRLSARVGQMEPFVDLVRLVKGH